MLELPDFDALTPEQSEVVNLPLESSTLVTGAPGTGKTVMAIYRSRALHRSGIPTLLLMYGKLLSTYTRSAVVKLEIDGVVSTYHKWFPQFYRRWYGEDPPRVDKWTFDWAACKERILGSDPPEERRHILVDEGQDMPKDFYLVLALVSRSMTVFADENQRITAQQSTIAEIMAATGITEVLRTGLRLPIAARAARRL